LFLITCTWTGHFGGHQEWTTCFRTEAEAREWLRCNVSPPNLDRPFAPPIKTYTLSHDGNVMDVLQG